MLRKRSTASCWLRRVGGAAVVVVVVVVAVAVAGLLSVCCGCGVTTSDADDDDGADDVATPSIVLSSNSLFARVSF